jgi:hypothetical protein
LNLVYYEMTKRVRIRDGQSAEDARKSLDAMLSVAGWTVPGREPVQVARRDPRAPYWWYGSEDASETFLTSMGVNL